MTEITARPKKARVIPFGYKQHPDNPDYLIPIPLELEAIKKAKEFLKEGYPWRSIHSWILTATNRKVSLAGLRKILLKRTFDV